MCGCDILMLGYPRRLVRKGLSRVRAQEFVRAEVRQSPAQLLVMSGCALQCECGVCLIGQGRMAPPPPHGMCRSVWAEVVVIAAKFVCGLGHMSHYHVSRIMCCGLWHALSFPGHASMQVGPFIGLRFLAIGTGFDECRGGDLL